MNRTQIKLESVAFPPFADTHPDSCIHLNMHVLTEFLKFFERLATAIEAKIKFNKNELFLWDLKFFGIETDTEEKLSWGCHLAAKVSLVDAMTRLEIAAYPHEIVITHAIGKDDGIGLVVQKYKKPYEYSLPKIVQQITRSLNKKIN